MITYRVERIRGHFGRLGEWVDATYYTFIYTNGKYLWWGRGIWNGKL